MFLRGFTQISYHLPQLSSNETSTFGRGLASDLLESDPAFLDGKVLASPLLVVVGFLLDRYFRRSLVQLLLPYACFRDRYSCDVSKHLEPGDSCQP